MNWIVRCLLFIGSATAQAADGGSLEVVSSTGQSPSGSTWLIERPRDWNGTVLLYSHGWAGTQRPPSTARSEAREMLLAKGYALVASNYSRPGWALREAVPDQIDALDQYARAFGKPRRVLAWGHSMGGLVTSALLERHPDRFDGAVVLCASSAGAVGMLNYTLDGAFAFVTLLAPDAGIKVVGAADDRETLALVAPRLAEAQKTPQGRARLALAAVLGGIPDWVDPADPRPAPGDYKAIATQLGKGVGLLFPPRSEQEARAGGIASWNTGVDYADQLRKSGRKALVVDLYRRANLDLDADLRTLRQAARVVAQSDAVRYMTENFTPRGSVHAPILTVHTIGDGMTSPSLPRAYADTLGSMGRRHMIRSAWVNRAGHCTFTPAEEVASITALERRIDSGRWSATPAQLNADAELLGDKTPAFIDFTPWPMLRPCRARDGRCEKN